VVLLNGMGGEGRDGWGGAGMGGEGYVGGMGIWGSRTSYRKRLCC
jgi:hypothetical protein